jgi:8-hydroxy-5-deazaflavin:NADPH oxidoreductase
MKISIIGTGMVGRTLATKFLELGHEVFMGTRNVKEKLASNAKDSYGNPSFSEWYGANPGINLKSFEEAASQGEVIINATHGESSVSALKLAGAKNLSGKILIDVANPLDFSKGMPPSLLTGLNNTNSLGEEIQKVFPGAKVVKTLNTMWCGLMVNPGMIGGGDHINFLSGNDRESRNKVKKLLNQLGWKDENLIDLGDIKGARATEAALLLWVRLNGTLDTGAFNFRIVR